jgi:hypothetical protein
MKLRKLRFPSKSGQAYYKYRMPKGGIIGVNYGKTREKWLTSIQFPDSKKIYFPYLKA